MGMDDIPSAHIMKAIKRKKKAIKDLRAWFDEEEE